MPCSGLDADSTSRSRASVSFTGRDRSAEIAATRATASAKSFLPTRSTLSLPRGMTRSYSGNVPSISLLVSSTWSAWNWMRVSDSADLDVAGHLVQQFAQLVDGLARDDDAGHRGGAVRQRLLHPGEAMAVGGDRAQHLGALAFGDVQIDAVEVVAGFLGADGEPRAVDQAAQASAPTG